MDKPFAEHLETGCVINVEELNGAVFTDEDGGRLYALRAGGDDADTEEPTSVALIFTAEELAVVCSRIARIMIEGGDTEILLAIWHETLLAARLN